jgi:polysaccharide biosynthesis protein PslG
VIAAAGGACGSSDPTGAPDPGGDEEARVPVPPNDVAFGFNDNAQVTGVAPGDQQAAAAAAGANAVRFPLDWRLVEPARDEWRGSGWGYYGAAYDAALAAGLTPVVTLGSAPAWARDPGPAQACADFFACRYPPAVAMGGEWTEFAEEAARRFPEAVFEVWNEPNLAIFWRPAPEPERFARLQALAFDAIKAVAPDATVLSGGLSAIQPPGDTAAGAGPADLPLREFLDRAYRARPGLADHMDAISFHPYPFGGGLGAGTDFAAAFDDVRDVAAENGDSGRRLWVTETGVASSGPGAVTEAQQTEIELRLYRRLATMPDVDGIFIHRLLPPPEEATTSTEAGYALLRGGTMLGSPKPAFCAFVRLAGGAYEGC